ncbi:hypothetical protein C6I21_13795 [Alkalicoccus urumqiensis]|uniref:Uncharacterized protein n=1 Tax=Alkalicoccus urumqiensis TaxID=1548213 RepID=A0A2P6ME65_ALKUR|nr:hypothetical protein C6I21_13795 [Alkalicoccus urumqiensis]
MYENALAVELFKRWSLENDVPIQVVANRSRHSFSRDLLRLGIQMAERKYHIIAISGARKTCMKI